MADLKGPFIDWLVMNVLDEHKALAWQMIDSFARHYYQTNEVAAHYRFAFPEEIVPAAQAFERRLKSLPIDAVGGELGLLQNLRPVNIAQLPILVAETPLEQMLESKTGRYQPIFRGFSHQHALKDAYDRLNDKKKAAAVSDCLDFPHNNIESQHKLAEELFDAILDCSSAEEKPRLLAAKKSRKRKASVLEGQDEGEDSDPGNAEPREWVDNTHVKRIKAASDVEIQFIAWNLLEKTRDAQNGLVGIGPWATNWKYNKFDSFRARFDTVKEVCRASKAIVASMMTGDDIFTRRLAAGPLKELKQKRQNRATNAERDEQNKTAIYCEKMGWVRKDQDGIIKDAHGNVVVPSAPRRA